MTATRAEVLAKLASIDHQLPMPRSISFVDDALLSMHLDTIADVKTWAEWAGEPVDEYYCASFSRRQAGARFAFLGLTASVLASEKLSEKEQAALEDEHETYAQAELDQDRNPTAEGFAEWKARRSAVGDDYSTTMQVNPDGTTDVVAIPQRAEQ